ncbi:Flp pilus assembly complex ATPase component TadA [Ideonella sp. 4Y11]|uniref:Flp pilus assembly complex ATPase component TadA n=1 Tax=Ideonella aquatica TaxID=2824119 RepID=A0A940YHG1_9BURK|nr:ATPase, T2SS/T4P/T4SS family [Ideonella aquatica]MBQ0960303.1 Flp pilus assembly complex ATPase component TadA [Ideonella aquatica]
MSPVLVVDGVPGQASPLRLEGLRFVIGKELDCEVTLPGWRVSRRHAEVFVSNDRVFVRDLASAFGTLINERKIDGMAEVDEQDQLRVGGHLLTVRLQRSPVAATETAAPADTLQRVAGVSSAGIAEPAPATDANADADDALYRYRRALHGRLLDAFDVRRVDTHRMGDAELRELTERMIRELIAQMSADLPPQVDRVRLLEEVRDEAIGLGPLEPLLADASVTEVMVNRHDEVFVERAGRLQRWPVNFTSDRAVQGVIERIVAPIGRRIDESSPMVDARLKDGSRVNAVIPPLALKGPSITIRKFSRRKLGSSDLLKFGSASPAMIEFLRVCVEQRKNMLISGGTGSGKTTLLNILSNFIPDGERIVTIEDAAELQLHHANLVSMEARPANIEGKGAVSIRDLVRNSLRMRPDRVVVGECRGGEALDMLQAMNTGHDGSLTTAHANSPRDMLARLEVMVLMAGMDLPVTAIREQVASALDIIVQQTRFACGTRKITSIVEVTGVESGRIQLQEVFAFQQSGVDHQGKTRGHFTGRGFVPEFYEQLQRIGVPLDLDIFFAGMPAEEVARLRRP